MGSACYKNSAVGSEQNDNSYPSSSVTVFLADLQVITKRENSAIVIEVQTTSPTTAFRALLLTWSDTTVIFSLVEKQTRWETVLSFKEYPFFATALPDVREISLTRKTQTSNGVTVVYHTSSDAIIFGVENTTNYDINLLIQVKSQNGLGDVGENKFSSVQPKTTLSNVCQMWRKDTTKRLDWSFKWEWRSNEAALTEEQKEERSRRKDFAEKWKISDKFTVLYDTPEFQSILVYRKKKDISFDFSVDTLAGVAKVSATNNYGENLFMQPIIHANASNAKLTSLRFSDHCGCATLQPGQTKVVAEIVTADETKPFRCFLRFRADNASYWNLRNTESMQALRDAGQEFILPSLHYNALFQDDYVYEKLEYSNGVSMAFRELDEVTYEMYVDNHNDKAVRLEFDYWSTNTIVTPCSAKGSDFAKIKEIIPPHVRTRLIEIKKVEGKVVSWGHSWKWFRDGYKGPLDRAHAVWNRLCYLHPEGHCGVALNLLDNHLQHFEKETGMTIEAHPCVEKNYLHFMDFITDWDKSDTYTLAHYLMWSKEEIRMAFKKTELSYHPETTKDIWGTIFEFHPLRNRFLWPTKEIIEAFDGTYLGLEDADHCWLVIEEFLGW